MGEKKKRQEIFERSYDEFLGHPDTLEEFNKGLGEDQYPVLSGNEGMHDVVKHAMHIQARAESAEVSAPAKPPKREPAKKREAPKDQKKERLVHVDYTGSAAPAAPYSEVVEIHGSEAMQEGSEFGWHK